ncbi:hypothetical protein NDU88_004766 [Pleurodeles waltl]|uniref:BRCT domain-containing protein n=1 Tax=Pleurodeles waltl TaxID=8319 RepID=A0AAV7RJM9_PLEWA|nr:hypothetical protein NDU88_004766 [Pleurodeles waltl]
MPGRRTRLPTHREARQQQQQHCGQGTLTTKIWSPGGVDLYRPADTITFLQLRGSIYQQICRLQRQLSTDEYQLGLFSGQPVMFLSATSQPPCDNLIALMQLCGGKVSKTLRQAAICVGPYNGKRSADLICVSEK